MKKISLFLFLLSLSSHATIWTMASFELECSKLKTQDAQGKNPIYGEFTHAIDRDGVRTVTCLLGNSEVSSVKFDKLNTMTGYDVFTRKGQNVLKHEIYDKNGILDNQEVYIQKGDDSKLIYFRINSKGQVTDGHYMIPPEMIKIIPMGEKALIAVDNGKQISLDHALGKIKTLINKEFRKELNGLDVNKQNFSEVILELNRRQLSSSQNATIKKLPAASEKANK